MAVSPNVFINEIHYDNSLLSDTNEFVEIVAPIGTSLAGWTVVLYNGSDGTQYASAAVTDGTTSSDTTHRYFVLNPTVLGTSAIQDGAPDGVALINDMGTVVEFLSYEGSFVATDGPAAGMTSTDIGVAESSSTPAGFSLQRKGTGFQADDFTWSAPSSDSPAAINAGQTFTAPPTGARINEFHYDNAGTDIGEFIEIRVTKDADVTGVTVALYTGAGGIVYDTLSLLADGTKTSDASYDYYVIDLPTNGLQNGPAEGIALVDAVGDVIEFLSYEGTLTATGGPAVGQTSTDIGQEEGTGTAAGDSLQRLEGDTWDAPRAETKGADNTPFEIRINEFHYDNAGTDIGEFIEIRVTKDADITGVTVALYTGAGGVVYGTLSLLADGTKTSDASYDYYVIDLPTNGLQNGPAEGIALVDAGGDVIEFLSYEGILTATDGPAVGQTLLRVVGCLPSAAGLLALTDAQWAGVGQASREETA
ncbi:MAG: hypothetical protein KDI88_18255, partial [Gammaproteobacteria bacterium]|nr:hypothetical protein [Gammaproteobacteria bacterium]